MSDEPMSGLPAVAALLAGLITGALMGLIDVVLVPLYAGTTPLFLAVLVTVAGNVLLPLIWGAATGRVGGAAAPLVGWLVVVLLLATSTSEGDVLLPAGSLQYVTYGVLLGGVLAGLATVAVSRSRR